MSDLPDANGLEDRPSRRLPRTIVVLGLTSFFADVASEMIFPLLPVFLTQVLRAGPSFLGIVEGAADTVSGLLKLVAGNLSDRFPRRKPMILFGYGIAGLARPLVALATAPWHVLAIRLTDRVGKGVRSAPRDALIADTAQPGQVGRAFGFHRAMDHAGAVAGPLVAFALLAAGVELRTVFLAAMVPSLVSIALVFGIREPVRLTSNASSQRAPSRPLPHSLRSYLLILLVFSLGNSADAFLLIRAHSFGVSERLLPILWAVLHISKLASSYFGGAFADRVPRTRLVISGWAVYAAVYLGLAFSHGPVAAWVLFTIYGFYYGLTEPAEKALVRDLAPAEVRGKAYGYYNFVVGISALPASAMMGWLWQMFGPAVGLTVGAAFASLAAVLLVVWRSRFL